MGRRRLSWLVKLGQEKSHLRNTSLSLLREKKEILKEIEDNELIGSERVV
jgi:hypothetical protein